MDGVDVRRAALARGAEAEQHVADLYVEDGWVLLARNWRGGGGELDLVVERAGCIRFVEVKQRDLADPTGLDAIGPSKQRKLRRAAEAWLDRHGTPAEEACFAVALVQGASVTLIDNAFDG
jgi:putative endonuclease